MNKYIEKLAMVLKGKLPQAAKKRIVSSLADFPPVMDKDWYKRISNQHREAASTGKTWLPTKRKHREEALLTRVMSMKAKD